MTNLRDRLVYLNELYEDQRMGTMSYNIAYEELKDKMDNEDDTLNLDQVERLWENGFITDAQHAHALSRKESLILHNPDPHFEIDGYDRHNKREKKGTIPKIKEKDKLTKNKGVHDFKAKQAKEPIERPKTEGNILDDLDYVNENVTDFWMLTERMTELYSRKNRDYGNSFDESLDEDGMLNSKIRLNDKMRRFQQLIKEDALVKDESIEDTLMDIANYAIMTIKWMEENKDETRD